MSSSGDNPEPVLTGGKEVMIENSAMLSSARMVKLYPKPKSENEYIIELFKNNPVSVNASYVIYFCCVKRLRSGMLSLQQINNLTQRTYENDRRI